MYLDRKLDRETTPVHMFNVTAEEATPQALRSHVSVSLVVLDVNDNAPELTNIQDLFACEKDERGTVIGTIGATDKDEHQQSFHFSLAKQSPKFSLTSHFDSWGFSCTVLPLGSRHIIQQRDTSPCHDLPSPRAAHRLSNRLLSLQHQRKTLWLKIDFSRL
ncbi:hypothetical protein JZ751_019386 [Albula glossodonta]|uniref:Cadherin domain-containing protein n=1 Tax=Albula glossodonta TaxID=121402 RepID=A0A8T2NMM8_9TELE|nr:hypothetical protein JZ751_019386 [Albula glossodonta]